MKTNHNVIVIFLKKAIYITTPNKKHNYKNLHLDYL
jgi:hypothetical protein